MGHKWSQLTKTLKQIKSHTANFEYIQLLIPLILLGFYLTPIIISLHIFVYILQTLKWLWLFFCIPFLVFITLCELIWKLYALTVFFYIYFNIERNFFVHATMNFIPSVIYDSFISIPIILFNCVHVSFMSSSCVVSFQ